MTDTAWLCYPRDRLLERAWLMSTPYTVSSLFAIGSREYSWVHLESDLYTSFGDLDRAGVRWLQDLRRGSFWWRLARTSPLQSASTSPRWPPAVPRCGRRPFIPPPIWETNFCFSWA